MTAVGLDAQMHAATDMVLAHAKQLVMAALIGRESWVLVTHFDVFLQNESGIDDCALPSDETFSSSPSAKITTKNEFRSNWKEVIIQWGCLQFLAVWWLLWRARKIHKECVLGLGIAGNLPTQRGRRFHYRHPFLFVLVRTNNALSTGLFQKECCSALVIWSHRIFSQWF